MTTTQDETGPGPLDTPLPDMPPMPPPPPPVDPPARGRRAGAAPRRTRSKPAAKKPAAPAARTRRPAGPVRPDYRDGIRTAIESACIPLSIAAMRGDQLAALNVVTLDMHKDNVAESLQQLADMYPAADKVIGYVAQVGPAGAIVTGLAAPILQMMTNAGMIPIPLAVRMGCVHPQELLRRVATFDLHADQAAAATQQQAPPPAPEPAPDPVI